MSGSMHTDLSLSGLGPAYDQFLVSSSTLCMPAVIMSLSCETIAPRCILHLGGPAKFGKVHDKLLELRNSLAGSHAQQEQ